MRRREISPEFWVDERVVEVSDGAKLLFIGLWNIADREGRLEDKPRTIGLKVRPWDPTPVVGFLDELIAQGMVRRYEVDGVRCLCIPRFSDHQNIHPKEMASKLPAPPAHGAMHVQPTATTDAAERLDEPRSAAETSEIIPFPSGSSGSSFPSGSSGPADDQHRLKSVERGPLAYVAPDKPSHLWAVEDFFAWAQSKRQEAGWVGEPRPRRSLSVWWNEVTMTPGMEIHRCGVDRLRAGFVSFARDDHWQRAKPPAPFQAFMAKWRDHVPPEIPGLSVEGSP